MLAQEFRRFSEQEHQTWRTLFHNLDECRASMAHPIFAKGVAVLGMDSERIPDLDTINQRLGACTGWKGVAVVGLEENGSFFEGLAHKKFPIGNFIRDARDVNYTPAPDVFHDLYGHLPFFADDDYAEFCQELGRRAAKYKDSALAMDLWGRLFWFGVEFPIIETKQGRKIFGGGILSSRGESYYCLSKEPEVIPFDERLIIEQQYKIDEFQKKIFLLKNEAQLYNCLDTYEVLLKQKLTSYRPG